MSDRRWLVLSLVGGFVASVAAILSFVNAGGCA